MQVNELTETVSISPLNSFDFLSTHKQNERGHCTDPVHLTSHPTLVHVDFGEDDIRVVVGELLKHRSDHAARRTPEQKLLSIEVMNLPISIKIDDDKLVVGGLQNRLQLSIVGNVFQNHIAKIVVY